MGTSSPPRSGLPSTPSLCLPAASPQPPTTRVSNAPHRAAPCGGSGGWDVRGGDIRHGRLCRVNFDEKRRCRRDSEAAVRPPGCGRERGCVPLRALRTAGHPPLAELLPRAGAPPRSVVHGRGPGQEGVKAGSVRLQTLHLLSFILKFFTFSLSPQPYGQCS